MKDGSTGNVHKISFDSIFMPVHDNNVVAVHPDLKAVRLTNLAFLPFPVGAGEDDATVLSSCNWTYIVNKDSKNLDLAKEYCEFILTSEEGQKWMAEGVGAVPGAKSDMEVTGALANDAKTYIDAGKTNGWIHTIAPGSYADECGPYLQSYMLGDMSADEVTQLFQDFWTSAE